MPTLERKAKQENSLGANRLFIWKQLAAANRNLII